MDRKSTFGLSTRQLSELLAVVGRGEGPALSSRESIAGLLQGILATRLVDAHRSGASRSPSRSNQPRRGATLGELLLDGRTSPEALASIRDHAKRMTRNSGHDDVRAAAIMVYYTAIAACLVRHQRKITSHSWAHLQRHLAALLGKAWITAPIKSLFDKALQVCSDHLSR